MSLRHYLFSLIGALILLLTSAQLFLVYWIDQNLAQEVNQQAKVLSERAVEFVFKEAIVSDGVEQEAEAHVIRLPVNEQQTQVLIVPDDGEAIEADVHRLIENAKNSEALQQVDKIFIKQRLDEVFDALSNEQVKKITKNVEHLPENQAFTFSHSLTTQSSSSESLITSIQWMILACALLAIVFAYWLSAQFNKPLNALQHGFEALARQDYDYRLEPHGVKEIKQTMVQFNEMLSTLAQLKQVEQHYKETAHLAELGEVSRGLAHTLRNPIHTIGLSIERLVNNDLNETERLTIVKTIQSKIQHVDRHIKSLLTLTTTGISRDQDVPVLAVIQDIVLEFKLAAVKKQTFTIEVPETISILGAESEVRSILHTLIINACEENEDDGLVHIRAESIDNKVVLSVDDSGKGVSPDIATRLFEPHVSTKPEGAGMGLYIAQRIIQLHYHGNIALTNKDNNAGCVATAVFYQKDV